MPVTSSGSLFVYFGFLCSQVSSVSNFHSDTRGWRWSFVYLLCYCVVGREGNRSCRHVWGVLAVYGPHWVCLTLRWCVLPGSTLLRLQGAQQGHCPKQFHALPRSKLLRFLGTPQRQTQLGMRFCALPGSEQLRRPGVRRAHYPRWALSQVDRASSATQFPRRAARAPSQVCCVSPLGSWSRAATLLADVNRLGSQEDMVSNWEPAHSLVEDAVSGAEIGAAPCFLALAVPCLPLCLQCGGRGLYTAG